MIQAKVNNQHLFKIDKKGETSYLINEQIVEIDKIQVDEQKFHVISGLKSYSVEIVSENKEEKTVSIKVNNTIYSVKIEDQYDQLLKQLGMDNMASKKVKEVKAPMPGLVLDIVVEVGTEVKKGDTVLILEAMKMENVIKSPTDGIVKSIAINTSQAVEKNQILIQFE